MIDPIAVIASAREWVGVPFLHQGRSRRGVDCVGLVIAVAADLGLLERDFERRDYGRLPTRGELAEKLSVYCDGLETPRPGCILAMRWNRETAHLAIFTGPTMIHAYERRGRVVEHSFSGLWPRRVDRAYSLPGVRS